MYTNLTVKEVIENVKGFKTFVFDDSEAVRYLPGQYLTLVDFFNKEEIRRSYSILSTPALPEPLMIGVKRVQNGFFSRRLVDETLNGGKLLTIGAGGLFILPDQVSDYGQIFFFAAGAGITPVFSLLKTVLYAHQGLSAVLIYSNASEETTIFLKELQALEADHRNRLFVQFIFSNNRDLKKAHLHREYLMELVADLIKNDVKQCLFYICGPEAYMRMCTYSLQEMNVPKQNIRRENFVIQKVLSARLRPPDRLEHRVTVHVWGRKYEFSVSYPDSILLAAKKKKIQLPYSCEAGSCGSCLAKCISGNIWLSNNEVLTDTELQRGLTLTCVGHPVGGDAVLEIGATP